MDALKGISSLRSNYQRSCDSGSSTHLVIIILLNKLFRLGITCPLALGEMLISTFIFKLLTKHINMYFLKYNKPICLDQGQVGEGIHGESIREQTMNKLVCRFQHIYTIRPELPACYLRINIWEAATQMRSQ